MALNEMIDAAIRKSFIGVRLTEFRTANPALYQRLRSVYEKMMSFRSRDGLARYQSKAISQFCKFVPETYRSKTVLEIGSDLDAKVIVQLKKTGCGEVFGINPQFEKDDLIRINATLPQGCVLKQADMRSTELSDGSIGAIFSVSVFEHLLDFELCLSEMHRLLIPGGYVYAEFGPIWSCSLGHHVYAKLPNGEEARHWDPRKNPVPNHGHLLMEKAELLNHLNKKISNALSLEAVDWIFEKPYINRLFFDDYIRLINNSKFKIIHIEPERDFVPDDRLSKLKQRYPEHSDFDVRNIRLVMQRQ